MINVDEFLGVLKVAGVGFFAGVPDSFLNGFCNRLLQEDANSHVIAPNEGNAVAVAAGHYFATGEVPLVYMQNSGMGNAVNPLASLVDKAVYGVPLVLLIGWRGEPGKNDWAQHQTQGRITVPLLNLMDIPNVVLNEDTFRKDTSDLIGECRKRNAPVAIVVPKGLLDGNKTNEMDETYPLSRYQAIDTILNAIPEDAFYLATTGRTTRELFYLRKEHGQDGARDFLNVGAMGHTLSVAIGLAKARPADNFVVLDGDAASIMHMGSMAMAGSLKLNNLFHIVLNNGSHESVGGQPSAGFLIDYSGVAKACGYTTVPSYVSTKSEIINAFQVLSNRSGTGFLEIRIHKGMEKSLPPLDYSHGEQIKRFMKEFE